MINSYHSCMHSIHQFYCHAESFIKLNQKLISTISVVAIGILSGLAALSLRRLNPPLGVVFYAISFASILFVIEILSPRSSGQIRNTDSLDTSFSSNDCTDSWSSSHDEDWTEFSD